MKSIFGSVLIGWTLATGALAQEAAELYRELSVELDDASYVARLMTPADPQESEQYPLVVFLHGVGERGDDNEKQLKFLPTWMADAEHRENYPCFLLAPQCPKDDLWTQQDWGSKKISEMPEDPNAALAAVILHIEELLLTEAIDPGRIYLTGLSMGGCGAWELAMRRPEWFAALAPVCGGGDPAQAELLRGMPVWAFHGDADRVVVPEWSRDMIAALNELEADPAPQLTEYPEVGHNSWGLAYQGEELLPWMFGQKKD